MPSNQPNRPNQQSQHPIKTKLLFHSAAATPIGRLAQVTQRVGLPYASSMLQQSNLTLQAIAMQLGFTDEFHLSRRFKQIKGLSPNAFRQQQCTASKNATYNATYAVDCAQLNS